jgi:hypothetical protein
MANDAQRSEVHQTTADAGDAPAEGVRPGTDPRPDSGLVPTDAGNEFRPGARTATHDLKHTSKGNPDPKADQSDFGGPVKIDDASHAGA